MSLFHQISDYIPSYLVFFKDWGVDFSWPLLRGELFLLVLVFVFSLSYYLFKSDKLFLKIGKNFIILFEFCFEKIYGFFDEILGEGQKFWVKSFVISMFFVILFSNLLGTLIDFLNTMFPGIDLYLTVPTTDTNFNIAMAFISVSLVLFLQCRKLGILKFIYEYLPIFGKNIITIEKGTMSRCLYYPLRFFVKIFDIVISLFVGILDIIGNIAKVISLSFRLTGNMMSGTILLGMAIVGMSSLTSSLVSIEFPVILPLIVVLQGLLVAVIQAFVFSLLTAIFIKVATE